MANSFSGNVFKKDINESRQGEVFTSSLMNTRGRGRKLYLESYGCAMNFSDSEIVASILQNEGFEATSDIKEADIALINTCSIRDNAEKKVHSRFYEIRAIKKKKPEMIIGVLGCMAERLKIKLLEQEKSVDLVVGPDAYKDLPNLISQVDQGNTAVNVLLSREETYADISPIRLGGNGVLAFVSIMRGCDNMCSFCVVPFTRGRERSRDAISIIDELKDLRERGYKDVTLLGQNVDSYHWKSELWDEEVTFASLLDKCAQAVPEVRIRFSTSHPKDITDEVLYTMRKYENLCKCIHLPVQSGHSDVLRRMNRTYDRQWYLNRVNKIREVMPECAITTDIITGFCGETEVEHKATLSILKEVQFDMAYMFKYSERPGTLAARKYEDNVPEKTKQNRLQEIISLQRETNLMSNQKDLGKVFEVLIEGKSKKSNQFFAGRNSHNKMVVFPKVDGLEKGDLINVKVSDYTTGTLKGEIV